MKKDKIREENVNKMHIFRLISCPPRKIENEKKENENDSLMTKRKGRNQHGTEEGGGRRKGDEEREV